MPIPNYLRVMVVSVAITLAASLLILGPPTNKAKAQTEPPPPLEGEVFVSTGIEPDTLTVSGSCDPLAETSTTFQFEASGRAGGAGPYQGTFTERGTIVLGTLDSTSGQRPVESLTAEFTIETLSGQVVTGKKTFEAGSDDTIVGLCFLHSSPELFDFQLLIEGPADIEIATPDGPCTRTGTTRLHLFSATDPLAPESFIEEFTGPFEPTTCEGSEPTDSDLDGIADSADNCPNVANADQTNTDGDAQGDACDADDDGDEVSDSADNCPAEANADQADADGDGKGDVCDGDVDGDGIADSADNCPSVANPEQVDTDGDGVGDACEASSYNFSGFLSPVDNLPTLNQVKAGRAIPVKFSLEGDRGLDIFADGYPKSQPIDCDSGDPVDTIEQTVSAGQSGLSYDATTDQYTYVWKTAKDWTGCRQLVLRFDDGQEYKANFQFVR